MRRSAAGCWRPGAAAHPAVVGDRGDATHQLQRRHLPQALPDRGVDQVARIPACLQPRTAACSPATGRCPRSRRLWSMPVFARSRTVPCTCRSAARPCPAPAGSSRCSPIRRSPCAHRSSRDAIQPATAAHPRQAEHAGGQDPVFRPAHAAVQAGQVVSGLIVEPGATPPKHQPVELRARGLSCSAL